MRDVCREPFLFFFFFFTENLPRLAQNADILSITRKRFKGDLCVSDSYFIDAPFLNVFSRSNAIF